MLYVGFRWLFRVFFKLFFRLKVIGKENIPESGAVILCSNHISVLDPPILGTPLKRKVRFMAKQELFQIFIFGKIITRLGAFPVKRGGISKDSIKTTLTILRNGGVLGIFPEGTRNSQSGAVKRGAATFAIRSDAAIIPVAIIGRYEWFRQMKVVYGEPINIDTYRENKDPARVEQVSELIMKHIRELYDKHNVS